MTNNNNQEALRKAACKQMGDLQRAAALAAQNYELQRAADLYGQALEISESIDYEYFSLYYRTAQSSAINRLGHLKQALAILTPILQQQPSADSADVFCNAIFSYLGIALDLPVKIATLTKVFAQAETFLQDMGKPDWQAIRLIKQSDLYLARGQNTKALAAAQESWGCYKEGFPQYVPDAHLQQLVECSLALEDEEDTEGYLYDLNQFNAEKHMNTIPKMKTLKLASRYSELARMTYRRNDAVDWARKALLAAEGIDNKEDIQLANTMALRAFLAMGDVERAQEYLLALFPRRHAEEGYLRYSVRLAWGDYHLAAARQAAGMEPVDDHHEKSYVSPKTVADIPKTQAELRKAARFYGYAMKLGEWIDTQLECHWRKLEVKNRLQRVERIAQSCEDNH